MVFGVGSSFDELHDGPQQKIKPPEINPKYINKGNIWRSEQISMGAKYTIGQTVV